MSFLKRLARLFGVEEVAEVEMSKPKKDPDSGWRAKRNRNIVERYKAGDTNKMLSHDYGLHHSTISRIVRRKKRGK